MQVIGTRDAGKKRATLPCDEEEYLRYRLNDVDWVSYFHKIVLKY